MPKTGKKLKVVNVSTEIATESPKEEEAPKEEAQEEVKEEVKPKSRARAKPKAKVSLEKVEEPEQEAPKEEAPKEEETPEEKEPEEEPEEEEEVKEEEQAPEKAQEEGKKSNNLVQCADCGKWLTPKGLKYSHKCPANKTFPKITQAPTTPNVIKKDSKIIKEKKRSPEGIDYGNIPEEIIQKEIEKRRMSQRELRIIKKAEIMKKLSMNIA